MELDDNIRYSGVSDMSGNIVCSRKLPGVILLLISIDNKVDKWT